MGSYAAGELNKMLDAFTGRATYTANAAVYVKLHIGDPGSAGTSNAAAETTRVQATFGSAASAGAISNTAALNWTNLAATETLTWVSFWTASSGGTFLGKDDLPTSQNVNLGGAFTINIGDIDLTLSPVA